MVSPLLICPRGANGLKNLEDTAEGYFGKLESYDSAQIE